jgi:transposase-like protein
MAQNRMTHQALLDQLQGADTDVLRRVLEHAMQRLIEAEAATQIGAGPHERSSSRTTYRNGYRERILDTGSGRLELQIPKSRTDSFFSDAARAATAHRSSALGGRPGGVRADWVCARPCSRRARCAVIRSLRA